jgi:hypothetical protein
MRKISIILLALMLCAASCLGEALPGQAAMDACTAVVSLHDSMMRGYFDSEYSFACLAGAGEIYMLFQDGEERNYLMVGLDETGERAATAVVQAYDEKAFTDLSLNSLRALYLPFCPDEERAAFESWLGEAAYAALTAAKAGEDSELDYYYGEFAACGISAYLDGEKPLFTALVDWYAPLSADDINALME